jgi:hypothetical protein
MGVDKSGPKPGPTTSFSSEAKNVCSYTSAVHKVFMDMLNTGQFSFIFTYHYH